jgi:hypothetical protein
MMARKNGVGQIIKAGIAVVALIALACRFRVIEAALDGLGGLTRWTRNAVWPAQLAYGLIVLHIINETLDIDLHHWAPVRGWELRCHQYRTSSHATTLESNKSVKSKLSLDSQIDLPALCPRNPAPCNPDALLEPTGFVGHCTLLQHLQSGPKVTPVRQPLVSRTVIHGAIRPYGIAACTSGRVCSLKA